MSAKLFDRICGGLVVSCQTGDNPAFSEAPLMAHFARAAVLGGAVAIRSEGREEIAAIKAAVPHPLIGLMKGRFENGSVRITREENEIETLCELAVDIIAVDATARPWRGKEGASWIRRVKELTDIPVMADIATFQEGHAALEAGADCLSTTLSGYTPETANRTTTGPDLDLLRVLVNETDRPVFAEGHYNRPEDVRSALDVGAWAVVVGSAITRPHLITARFVDAIRKEQRPGT